MQLKTVAALLTTLLLAASPDASAQRAVRGPSASRHVASRPLRTRTTIHYRHARDFEGYRRATQVHVPRRVWVPAHHEYREREVVIRGAVHRRWIPARFEARYDSCGRRFQVQLSAGYWTTVREPDRYEVRRERVLVPGYWKRR